MANCKCAGQTCGCLFEVGEGLLLSGIGSAADPYIIRLAAPRVDNTVLRFTNTPTVTWSDTGLGTPTDPRVMQATAVAPNTFPLYTTAGRPTAASVGDGKSYYDTTLDLPMWSNGVAWRPADSRVLVPKVGHYLLPSSRANGTTAGANASGVVAGAMIEVAGAITIDQLHAQVTTLEAATSAQLLVYKSDGDGYPAALVASGSIDCSTTGFKTVTIAPVTLQPGIYWVFIRSNSPGGLVRFTTVTQSPAITISASALGAVTTIGMNAEVGTYAAPLAVPTSVAPIVTGNAVFVGMRRSA